MELISQSFELEKGLFLDEKMLQDALQKKIAEMLDHEIDLLMSTLYRLDIIEEKIQFVLKNPLIPNDLGLAKLIIERQKEKLVTKEKYPTKSSEINKDLEW